MSGVPPRKRLLDEAPPFEGARGAPYSAARAARGAGAPRALTSA